MPWSMMILQWGKDLAGWPSTSFSAIDGHGLDYFEMEYRAQDEAK